MLATHQIKTCVFFEFFPHLASDLKHSNKFIAGLALCTLGNIASEQICRDCAPEIEQLLSEDHVDPYIRKKVCALCEYSQSRPSCALSRSSERFPTS
jgi:hypothetical protein